MPPLTPDKRLELAQEWGIGYKYKESWPDCYRSLFRNVENLGVIRLDDWENRFENIDQGNSAIKIWRDRTKRRALQLAKKAQKLGDRWLRMTELDWRELEGVVFEHLQKDVNCSTCSRRIWRCHEEVDATSMSPNKTLNNRQKQRKLCDCITEPNYESSIFGPRRECPVTYDQPLKSAMGKKNERPDLFYGPLQKGRMHKYTRGLTKTSPVRTMPFENKHTECVFPFLICEAKSGKASANQRDVMLQIGFAVRETLLSQLSLAIAANSQERAFEPLVWCVTYLGEHISIGVGCLDWKEGSDGDKGGYRTNLIRLWSGNLSSEDDALRCFLIIDYIADWARDVYRENIIKQLKLVVGMAPKPAVPASPTDTVRSYAEDGENDDGGVGFDGYDDYDERPSAVSYTPTTIHKSPWSKVQPSMEHNSDDSGDDSSRHWTILESPTRRKNIRHEQVQVHGVIPAASEDKMRRFDIAEYAYRDARYIRNRVMGLCITSRNVQDLYNSRAQHSAVALFSSIAVQLEKHQLAEMKGSTLVAMEQAWSGIHKGTAQAARGAETFYVSFTFSAYFSPDWEQTRELCYIAVSKDALDTIKRCRKLETKLSIYEVSHTRALAMVDMFQSVSISSNLSACLQSCSVRPIYSESCETRDLDDIFPKQRNIESIWMKPDSHRKTRDVVWNLFKPVVSEGENCSRSYLRLQSTLHEQTRPKQITRQPNSSPWIPCVLKEEEEHFVLSYNANLNGINQEQRPELCMFWANPDPFHPSMRVANMKEIRLEVVYRTSRLGVGKHWQKITWNEVDLAIPRFDKLILANCLDKLLSALVEEEQKTDINYALSQLQIHSSQSTPRQLRHKSVMEIHVEEIDDGNSDTQYNSLERGAASLRFW